MLVALRLGQAKLRCCEGQSARSALKVSVVVMLRTGLCSCVGDTMTMLGRCFFPPNGWSPASRSVVELLSDDGLVHGSSCGGTDARMSSRACTRICTT